MGGVRLTESALLGHHPAVHRRDLLARRFLLGEQRCHLSSEGDDIWVLLGVLRQKLAKRSLDLDDAALGVVRRTGIEKVGRNRLRDVGQLAGQVVTLRSEEHTSELQSLMRISYAVFCLQKKKQQHMNYNTDRDKQDDRG